MPPRIGPKRPVRVYLAAWREHLGLTQDQVGNRIHPPVDKGTVSRWENAKPGRLSLGVLAAYAEALGRPVVEMYVLPSKIERRSLDSLVKDATPEIQEMAVDIVERLIKKAS